MPRAPAHSVGFFVLFFGMMNLMTGGCILRITPLAELVEVFP
jgi:hypothetical protein